MLMKKTTKSNGVDLEPYAAETVSAVISSFADLLTFC